MKLTFTMLAWLIMANVNLPQGDESYLGKTDFHVLLKAIPAMPATTEAAFDYACNGNTNTQSVLNERFAPFEKKMELAGQQFAAAFSSKTNEYYGKKGNEGLYQDSKRQANQNEIIREMGGGDNIQKMSEEQRIAAAKNAAARQGTTPAFTPFTEEETKRMMNDPEYARQMTAKYNNLTEKQKAEMVRNQMSGSGQIEADHGEFERTLQKRQVAINTMEINQFVAALNKRISDAATEYKTRMDHLREGVGNHIEIDSAFNREYRKIPLVLMGEGKTPDPEQVKKLRIQYALKHKKRAALELSEAQINYKQLMSSLDHAISDYDDFLDRNKYRVNGKMSDVFKGTNTELSLVQAEQGIGSAISGLGEICYDETATAAGFEQHYRYVLSEYKY